ncbi:MAG: 50S ribosomal protein L22 [Patescibacteria group bacterium]
MKAHLRSVRIAPKKANLIAKMVRGMAVADAVEALRMTHKKAARLIEGLLRSAIANTSHNLKQDPQTMIIKTIVVNQGQAFRRGIPKARGQVRPIKKFLSHISIELGFPEEDTRKTGKNVAKKPASKKSSLSSPSSQ